MSSQLANTWKAHYKALSSNNRADRNLSGFEKATLIHNTENFEQKLIREVTEDPDSIILAISPILNKVKLYHSFTNLGGTRVNPDQKIVGLEGFGPVATPVIFDTDSITGKVNVRTPPYNTLKYISDPENVNPTTVTFTNNTPDFEHATFVILPPFLFKAFLEITKRDPENLLIETNSLIAAFDADIDANSTQEKAWIHCKHVVKFLWSASNVLIPQLECMVDPDDTELQQWAKNRHTACLTGENVTAETSTTDHSVAYQQLAKSIDRQNALFEAMKAEKTQE